MTEKLMKFVGFSDDNEFIKQYCISMQNINLSDLLKEPNLTKAQRKVYNDDLKENLQKNASKFIEIAGQSKCVKQQLEVAFNLQINDLYSKLNVIGNEFRLLYDLKPQKQFTDTFLSSDDKKLIKVLEIPNMIRSCLEFEKFDNAFDLINFIRKLSEKNSNAIIFQNLRKEVDVLHSDVFKRIFIKLRSDLDLAVCLQLISFLRQNSVITELEIKVEFIRARNAYLNDKLRNIVNSSKNVEVRLHKIIEENRSCLFEIITQFRIINDSESDENFKSQLLFTNWMHMRIRYFLKLLEEHLKPDNDTICLIFEQCMYFGAAFSRIGYDFRRLLKSIFLKHIEKCFKKNLTNAEKQFEHNLCKSFNISLNAPDENWPDALLKVHSLAYYCNDVLRSFNELQKFFFIELIFRIKKLMEESLRNVLESIEKFDLAESIFLDCFWNQLVPFLQSCFNEIVSFKIICSNFGLNLSYVQNEMRLVVK